ncbi:hypothetical protein TKK_0019120 [Trichogramma kaykai]|uniref:BTB domain-containing protein n=1 Tax=Trichogramma kaykai TaxID=54128 RepID=A0ABD2VUX1_9HYME
MPSTSNKAHTREFTWTINDYSKLDVHPKVCIKSPEFKVDSSEKVFYVKFFPLGYEVEPSTGLIPYAGMILCQASAESFNFSCKVKLLVDDDPVVIARSVKTSFNQHTKRLEFPQLFPIQDLSEVISDEDVMVIRFELTIYTKECKSMKPNPNREITLRLKLDSLFLNENLSDVNLRTACGKCIPAHKAILASASPIFHNMFTHEMLENETDLVDITDISNEVLIEMLRYIYLGSIDVKVPVVCELLGAANKYDIQVMKTMCEKLLLENLSIENARDVYKAATKYDSNYLKNEAIKCFYDDSVEMIKSVKQPSLFDEFDQFLKNYSNK